MTSQDDGALWLFGYGSLIWKPPPHYDRRVPGYVENFVRRFWQASQDHRGTPEAPGRVVTLITRDHWETLVDQHSTAPPRTWGAAYHIPEPHVQEVREYLDIREINGYTIDMAAFHVPVVTPGSQNPRVEQTIQCLVYIGLPSNPQFVGPQDPDALAAHIVKSRGPSGENTEYLYNLELALAGVKEEAGVDDDIDPHITDLAARVRKVEAALGK